MSSRSEMLEELFHEAADLPPVERRAFLDARCGGDTEMRSELDALLAEDQHDLDSVIADAAAMVEDQTPLPARIGEFEIVRMIGEGGMGCVYEARQQSPQRTVALKVIRAGLMSRQATRRFSQEATVLGNLKHAGIAQVFQAGAAAGPDGAAQPYFAMEFVSGPTLTEFARSRRLDVTAKLELWARVCDAVQHAHQRGVIHRDLKPGNILVESLESGEGQPKILDFGIARLTDPTAQPAAASATMKTEAGQIIGTLGYMSPEQVEGDSSRLDTRSDVYALGVIGHELLAGKLPLEVAGLTIVEAARVICTVEPKRLGVSDPKLGGDIETIVAKALEKERDRRYSSAAELAADIRRHLNHEPIAARPAGTIYHLSKFARRNRALVGAAAIAVAALVVGSGVAVWYAVAAMRQRDKATAMSQFMLTDVFSQANLENKGPNISAVQMLKEAEPSVEKRFGNDPTLHASIEYMLMELTSAMGDNEGALRHLNKTMELTRKTSGQDSRAMVQLELQRVQVMANREETRELLAALGPVKERVRTIIGPTSAEALQVGTLEAMALLQDNRQQEAAARLGPLIREHENAKTSETINYLLALNTMVQATRASDDGEAALGWSEKSMAWVEKRLAPESPHRVAITGLHGSILASMGRLKEAEPVLRTSVDQEIRNMPVDDPGIAMARRNYASVLMQLGRCEEAEKHLREAARVLTEKMGEGEFITCETRRALYEAIRGQGDAARTEEFVKGEIATCLRLRGGADNDPMVVDRRRWHADVLIDLDRLDEAERELATIESLWPRGDSWESKVFWAWNDVVSGRLLAAQGKKAEARAKFEQAREGVSGRKQTVSATIRKKVEIELEKLGKPGEGASRE